MLRALSIGVSLMLLPACVTTDYVPSRTMSVSELATTMPKEGYPLGAGDKLKVEVYGEEGLTGEQIVGPDGSLTVPLIGKVAAGGRTTEAVAEEIRQRLGEGFVKRPSVTVTILTYRPFYILGEVNQPGQYEYAKGMTLLGAVARAGGYTYRAKKTEMFLKREGLADEVRVELTSDLPILPGDTIRIGERYF